MVIVAWPHHHILDILEKIAYRYREELVDKVVHLGMVTEREEVITTGHGVMINRPSKTRQQLLVGAVEDELDELAKIMWTGTPQIQLVDQVE